ncbi:hypothetical protein HDK77DRAFT_484193 [Phyllosticta capitalensis]|uniref:uncharacterized protein n=1 Tax=Phyllosticta capitalensis TaxID=121624 RepID=UPI00312D4D82
MCKKATCDTCRGNHIPTVMADVPADEWCGCDPKVEIDGTKYPPKGSLVAS